MDRPPTPIKAHRPWCQDCKRRDEDDSLDSDGVCPKCARARISRAAAAERRALEAPQPISTPKKPRPRTRAEGRPSRGDGEGRKKPKVDDKRIVAMYKIQMTVKEISDEIGCNEVTVRKWLKHHKVYDPSRDSVGRKRNAFCKNGHDLEVTRRPIPSGGSYCIECKRVRDRRRDRSGDIGRKR